jgi:uncharacterized protein YjeT (DUF2065 family)
MTANAEPLQLFGGVLIMAGVLLTKWLQFKAAGQNIQLKNQ